MTVRTRTALATQFTTLIDDNTSGDISASDVRSVLTDLRDSCFNLTDDVALNVPATNITLTTGGSLRTNTTTANTGLIQAYDVDGAAYSTFVTLTNGNTPSCAIAQPVGATLTIDGAVIGGTTPLAGHFTTLSTTGAFTGGASSDITINTNKFTVTASSGNTVVAGTLAVTGNLTPSAYVLNTVATTLTAVGTNQGTALQLAKQINNITSAASGTGVILPAAVVGMRISVFNSQGSNNIKVYGNGSDTIDGVAAATGVTLSLNKRCDYFCTAAATWISAQLGVVSA